MRCIVVALCFVADMIVSVGITTKTVFMQFWRSVSELNLMPHTNAVVADAIPHQIILVLLYKADFTFGIVIIREVVWCIILVGPFHHPRSIFILSTIRLTLILAKIKSISFPPIIKALSIHKFILPAVYQFVVVLFIVCWFWRYWWFRAGRSAVCSFLRCFKLQTWLSLGVVFGLFRMVRFHFWFFPIYKFYGIR